MSRFSLRLKVATALGVAVSMVLAGCGGGDGGGDTAGGGAVDEDATISMVFPLGASLDPSQIPIPTSAMAMLWPVYERLVQVDVDNSYQPMLATSWEFSGDGTTLTFQLRDDVTFTDGEPFDAEAAKASIDFLRKSESVSSSGPLGAIDEVTAASPTQLELTLSRPTTGVLGALATPTSGSMISPALLESGDLANSAVGTGAYQVEEFVPNVSLSFTRRDDGAVWDEETGQAQGVEVMAQTSSEARVNAIRSGQIDFTVYGEEDKSALSGAIDSQDIAVTLGPSALMYTLYLNTNTGAFADPLVRQAANFAIDREGLAGVKGEAEEPRVQPWFDGMPGFDPELESIYSYDPDRARELLAEAGHGDRIDAGEIIVANASGLPQIAEGLRANLAEVGIDVELAVVDLLQANARWSEGTSAGMLYYMSANDPEPVNHFDKLYRNPYWWVGETPAKVTELLEGIGDPTRAAEQEELIAALNRHVVEEAYYVPVMQHPIGFMARSNISNFENAPFSHFGVGDFRYLVKSSD